MRKRHPCLSLSRWVVKARVGKSLSEKHGKDGGPSSFRFLGLKEICCLRRNWLPLKFVLIPFVRGNIRKKKKRRRRSRQLCLKYSRSFQSVVQIRRNKMVLIIWNQKFSLSLQFNSSSCKNNQSHFPAKWMTENSSKI